MSDTTKLTYESEILRPGQYTMEAVLGISENNPDYSTQKFYKELWNGLWNRCSNKENKKNVKSNNEILNTLRNEYNIETDDTFRDRFIKMFGGTLKRKSEHEYSETPYRNESKEMIDHCNFISIPDKLKSKEVLKFMRKSIGQNIIDRWLNSDVKPSDWRSRLTLYKLSFAYNLSWEKHAELFLKVCRSKLYWRTPEEFCLTYCKMKKKTYADAVNLYIKYLIKYLINTVRGNTSGTADLSDKGTRTVFGAAIDFSDDEFIAFLSDNDLKRSANTITKNTKEIIKQTLGNREVAVEKFLGFEHYCGYTSQEENNKDKNNVFAINFESNNKGDGNYTDILRKRKIYIICKFHNVFFSYDEKKDKLSSKKLSFENESRSDCFVGFISNLNRELIKMNLPIMDYLDDFDRGIILAAAYKTINNDEKKLIEILEDIIYIQHLSVTLFS